MADRARTQLDAAGARAARLAGARRCRRDRRGAGVAAAARARWRRCPICGSSYSLGAGVEHILAEPGLAADVPVVRLVDPYMTAAMGEYVEHQVLRLHRQDVRHRRASQAQDAERMAQERIAAAQRRRTASRRHSRPGRARRRGGVAARGDGLRCRRLEPQRAQETSAGIRCFHGADGLSAQPLARSEILVCLLPLDVGHRRAFSAAGLFARCRAARRIVNCARGRHLVEADLAGGARQRASFRPRVLDCALPATSCCRAITRSGGTSVSS